MKKIFIIFFVLIFMCTLLSGCGKYVGTKRAAIGNIIVDKLYECRGADGAWFAFVVKNDEGNHKIIYNIDINVYYSYKIGDIYMGD